jgi:lipopolysaccharide transport system ATP-binding protein
MGAVIKVENLSKQYRLGDVGTGSLKDDFKRFRYRLMGKEDPFLQIGEVNDRTKKSNSDYVWALKDVNFEIGQGDIVGIIGRNGAGKSTLLKILSRTTAPTTGSVKVKGRIASLLEVGTGFHGELTGRENIYLNGTIMGLRKWEIDKKLDEIIDFAGVEKYLDTPVKRYSSGMYVRLAFAVAAHLEPDILIVDEVLAVGDAEFQNRCLGKMKDVSANQGRTVLFVSHNIMALRQLCKNAIQIDKGIIKNDGEINSVLNKFLSENFTNKVEQLFEISDNKYKAKAKITKIYAHFEDFNIPHDGIFDVTKKIGISFHYRVFSGNNYIHHGISCFNNESINIFNSHDITINERNTLKDKGDYKVTVWINENFLNEGILKISAALFTISPFQIFDLIEECIVIRIIDYLRGDSARGMYKDDFPGIVRPILKWNLNYVS